MTFSAENMGAKRPIDPVSQVQRSAPLQPLFSSARISFSQCLYHSTAQRLFLIVRASSSRCDRNLARAVLTDLSQTLVCWPGLRQREVNLAVIDGFLGEATSRQPAQSSASKKAERQSGKGHRSASGSRFLWRSLHFKSVVETTRELLQKGCVR